MQGNHNGGTESNSWFHKITPGNWLTISVLIIGGVGAWSELSSKADELERRLAIVEPLVVEQAKLKVQITHLTEELKTTRSVMNEVLTQLRTYHTRSSQR